MSPAIRDWPGNADRPALALHCSMGSSSYWGPIAEGLSDIVAIRAVDAPGHGRNPDWLPTPDSPDFHTLFTQWAADQITGPTDLIGHSLGATVALRIAVERPDLVRTLTMIEPVLFAAAPEWLADPVFTEVDRLLAEGRDEDAARAFVAHWGASTLDDQPAERKARMIRQVRLVENSNLVLAQDRSNILRPGAIEAITAPAALIYSDSSHPSIAAVCAALGERLPQEFLGRVWGGGHMLPMTKPREVTELIRTNLQRA